MSLNGMSAVSSNEGEELYRPLVGHLPTGSSRHKMTRFNLLKWVHLTASVAFLSKMIIFAAIVVDATVNPIYSKPVHCDDFCDAELQHLGEINFRFLIPVVAALAYFSHLLCSVKCLRQDDSAELWVFMIGSNPLRWLEYSLTYSLMAVITAILAGVLDVFLWLLIFTSTAAGMGMWQVLEMLPRLERPDVWMVSFRSLRHLSFFLGAFAVLVPWLVIICYYARQVSEDTPAFVSAAVLGMVVLYLSLGVNVFLSKLLFQYDFTTSEVIYVVLSVVTQLYLAVTLYAGLRN